MGAQLQAACAGRSLDVAMPLLHTLRGLAGTVGADRLSGLAHLAEQALKVDASAAAWEQLALVVDAIPGAAGDVAQLARQLDPAGAVS